jgi:GT2 family glycosyltransferase
MTKKKLNRVFKAISLLIKNPIYGVRIMKGVQKHGLSWALDKSRGKLVSEMLSEGYVHPVDDRDMSEAVMSLSHRPLISVVVPVYNVEVRWLTAALESVWASTYPDYELVLVDDASPRADLVSHLRTISHDRTRILFNGKNQGISETSNRGVREAKGEFIVMMDHDDLLDRNALYHIAKALSDGQPDLIYSDEDKVDTKGNYKNPFYKPDWSPDLLRSQMYLGHIFAFRKEIFMEAGGFRTEFDGAQDYDLALRMTEKTEKICHLPHVLYSWREITASTAMNPDSKPYAHIAGQKALTSHLRRVYGEDAYARETEHYYVYDARYRNPAKRLTAILPYRADAASLSESVKNLLGQKVRMDLEVIILVPKSREKGPLTPDGVLQDSRVRIVETDGDRIGTRSFNQGILEARGDVLLFLDPDYVFQSEDGMERMAEKAMREGAGTVGAMLLDPGGRIISAGRRVDRNGSWHDVYRGALPLHYGTPFVSPLVTRNVAAADGRCMAISRRTLDALGSFNDDLQVDDAFRDMALGALEKKLSNIYDGGTRLVRRAHDSKEETPAGTAAWDDAKTSGHLWERDPFYNGNLDPESDIPRIGMAGLNKHTE